MNLKKYILLIGICAGCLGANAQKIDTSHLDAKWYITAMHIEGMTIDRDSISQVVQQIIAKSRAERPNKEITESDSLGFRMKVSQLAKSLSKCYFEFGKNNTYKIALALQTSEATIEEEGSYTWSSDHTVVLVSDKERKTYCTITPSGKGFLVLEFKDEADGKVQAMMKVRK